jgi:ATP-dependent DNA helicase RecG
MVLQFASKHGRITRKETADLCRISSVQAKHLLKRLVDRDLLVPRGAGRAAFYEPVSKRIGHVRK